MAYACFEVIYGIPFTKEIAPLIEDIQFKGDKDVLEDVIGFTELYAQGELQGYFGVKLGDFDEAAYTIQVVGLKLLVDEHTVPIKPTDEQIKKFRNEILPKIPKSILEKSPHPGVFFIAYSS